MGGFGSLKKVIKIKETFFSIISETSTNQ